MEINKINIDNLDNDISNKDLHILNDNITALSSYKIVDKKTYKSKPKEEYISPINTSNASIVDVNAVIKEVDEDEDEDEETEYDVDLLKKMVIRWIKLDDNIKECNKQAKEIKDEKTQIESKILLFMNNSDTNEIQVKDGKLEKKRGEKKESINEEYIKKCLVKSFDDVEMIDKLTKMILENREITETYKLARKSAVKGKGKAPKKQ